MRAFTAIRTGDDKVDRNLDGIAANLADLGAAPSILGIVGGTVAQYVDTATLGNEVMAVFTGATGKTLTMPGAKAAGSGVTRFLVVRNDSANTVTMVAGSGDSIVGTATVATLVTALFGSDGASRWLRVV